MLMRIKFQTSFCRLLLYRRNILEAPNTYCWISLTLTQAKIVNLSLDLTTSAQPNKVRHIHAHIRLSDPLIWAKQ